jgi:hypothetical protein
MKKLLTLSVACFLSMAAMAQDAEQMKAWQAYMTPGDVHKMLAKSDGKWTTETTMWMDPGQPPTTSKGYCINKMVLGGRYQETEFKGDMMGQPFEGRSTLAYDNAKQTFINTWIDNMGTGMMVIEGKWDDAKKCINFSGKVVDPMTGKDMPIREVFTIKDDNHQMMEMWMSGPDGSEMKSMEVKFTRATAAKSGKM